MSQSQISLNMKIISKKVFKKMICGGKLFKETAADR